MFLIVISIKNNETLRVEVMTNALRTHNENKQPTSVAINTESKFTILIYSAMAGYSAKRYNRVIK